MMNYFCVLLILILTISVFLLKALLDKTLCRKGAVFMRKIFSLAMAVCLLLLSTACNMIVQEGNDEQYDYPVTVGNTVFESSPNKVAVLSENLADIILACGYEGKLAMRSDACTQNELEILPSVGTPDEPDVNEIISGSVDLVLGDSNLSEEDKNAITETGAKVLIIKPASNDEELERLYENVSSILGGNYSGKMKAMSTFDSLQGVLDSIKNDITDTNVLTTVCYIYDVDDKQCRVASDDDYSKVLLDYAQVTNVAASAENGYIGNDILLRSNPEVIFCDEGVHSKLMANEDLKSLTAVKQGKVYTLPAKYLELQGQTRAVTVDYIAAKTHPLYSSRLSWPASFDVQESGEEYVAPFTPEPDIFYTVGESYSPIYHIEKRLVSLGYLSVEPDELYDEDTAYAVGLFQEANGLEVTGVADYNTLTILLSEAAVPSNNPDVGTVEYVP